MIIHYNTPPRKMQYARAKRRQKGGEKKGINRVFFLANRAEKQGGKTEGGQPLQTRRKTAKGRLFAQINRQTPFGILHSFEAGFLFKMPFLLLRTERADDQNKVLVFQTRQRGGDCPPPRFYSFVRLTHSVQRGSALISFSVCGSQGRRQNGQSSGNFSTTPRFEGSNLYFTPETSGAV